MSQQQPPNRRKPGQRTAAAGGRRSFLKGMTAVTAGGLSGAALTAAGARTARADDVPLALAEQGQFWVNVQRRETEQGTIVTGDQAYVWYQIPAEVRHPYPIVLVHGGGGQGTDWLGAADGGPGWATHLLKEGYAVYVLDRPGLGRAPFNPAVLGEVGPPPTYELIGDMFTATTDVEDPNPYAHLHTQWPGDGRPGDPAMDQFMAGAAASPGDAARSREAWRQCGEALLDRIGPAVVMTSSAGGPFGWLLTDARPDEVQAVIGIEPLGVQGLPLTYDPPVDDPSEIRTEQVTPDEDNVAPYQLQVEPARQLVNLARVPVLMVVGEGSSFNMTMPGWTEYMRQAGCDVTYMRLAEHGARGFGHFMMIERDNRDALQPILEWLDDTVG